MTDSPDFTPRNVAKYAVQATIQLRVTKLAKDTITDHTQFDSGNPVVKISSHVIGWGVAAKLKPHTDKVVDKTADFVVDKREKRQAKKAQKKNDQK